MVAVSLVVVAGIAESGTLVSHRTTGDAADVFYVRVFPFPSRVAWFAHHGMPEPRQIDQLAASLPASDRVAKVVYLGAGTTGFGPLERWLRIDGPRTYAEWLVSHPWYVVTEPLVRPERSYNFAQGNLAFYAGRPGMASPLTPIAWPPLVELAPLLALALYAAVDRRAWRHSAWGTVAAVTGVGLAAMLVAWHGDGQEVTRHTVEGFAEARLGLWVLVVLGLLGAPSPWGDRRRPARLTRRAHAAPEHLAVDPTAGARSPLPDGDLVRLPPGGQLGATPDRQEGDGPQREEGVEEVPRGP
jgi:hypothetical protein